MKLITCAVIMLFAIGCNQADLKTTVENGNLNLPDGDKVQARWVADLPDLHDMLLQIDPDYALMPKNEKERDLQLKLWSVAIINVSRQPEMESRLIDGLVVPKVDSSYLRASRYGNLKTSFEAAARQPELIPKIEEYMIQVSSAVNIGKTKLEQIGRLHSLTALIEGITRQPELAPQLKEMFETELPALASENHSLLIVGRVFLVGYSLASIARQPEFRNEIALTIKEYAGEKKSLTEENRKIVTPYLKMAYIEAIARQPELSCYMRDFLEEETGILVDTSLDCTPE